MEYIVAICKYGQETVPIRIQYDLSFEQLIELISNKWDCLENVQVVYSIPGHVNCLLRNGDELKGMFDLVALYALTSVILNVTGTSVNNHLPINVAYDTRVVLGMESDDIVSNNMVMVDTSSDDRPLLSTNWADGLRQVGQVFRGGAISFRLVLCKYAIERRFRFIYKRNDSSYVVAHCKYKNDTGCKWFVSASKCRVTKYFIVRKFVNIHTCWARVNREDSNRLSSKVVAFFITKAVKDEKKTWRANDVSSHLKMLYGQDVGYNKAWDALNKAKDKVFGNDADSYMQLTWYTRAARALNPGSHIVLDKNEFTGNFRRVFVAWAACINGFTHVRPTLFLDGAHLKGKYKGCLQSAIGKTGNQELYPLAYAVVDIENGDNWKWFLWHLHDVLDEGRKITFVSDRNAGLLDALHKVFPEYDHFFCLIHLKDNLRGKLGGQAFKGRKDRILSLFTACAYALTPAALAHCLEVFVCEGGQIAENFLKGLPFKKWTNAFSNGGRYGEMTSNAAESFNSWTREERGLPILRLIDRLREKLMIWFDKRSTKSDTWGGLLCPVMEDKLITITEKGRTWWVNRANPYVFHVMSTESNSVDFSQKTCTCRKWQLDGFPCEHAVSCINGNMRIEDYSERYWFVETYRLSYVDPIYPVPTTLRDEYEYSDDEEILPPQTTRNSGRPKKLRYRTNGEREDVRTIRCSRCNCVGNHNKTSCNAPI